MSQGVSVPGVSFQGVSVPGLLCPWGKCPGKCLRFFFLGLGFCFIKFRNKYSKIEVKVKIK